MLFIRMQLEENGIVNYCYPVTCEICLLSQTVYLEGHEVFICKDHPKYYGDKFAYYNFMFSTGFYESDMDDLTAERRHNLVSAQA